MSEQNTNTREEKDFFPYANAEEQKLHFDEVREKFINIFLNTADDVKKEVLSNIDIKIDNLLKKFIDDFSYYNPVDEEWLNDLVDEAIEN